MESKGRERFWAEPYSSTTWFWQAITQFWDIGLRAEITDTFQV